MSKRQYFNTNLYIQTTDIYEKNIVTSYGVIVKYTVELQQTKTKLKWYITVQEPLRGDQLEFSGELFQFIEATRG